MPATDSLLDLMLSLPAAQRKAAITSLSKGDVDALLYDWHGLWARPSQLAPPGNWRVWLVMAGRGFGKTRTDAEWVRAEVEAGRRGRIALVGATAADVRDVMIEGESGLLAIEPPWNRPNYEPSKRRLTWSNGAIATAYSADEPDRLRGPQHDGAWADEIAAWTRPDTWDNLMFGLRLGDDPRAVASTTPRPVKLVRELIAQPTTVLTRGSTYENRENLAQAFLDDIVRRYQGTRLGRQELYGELLEDVEGALWKHSMFDDRRTCADLPRVVVGVDPSGSTGAGANEAGIIVAGKGADGHGYVLDDRSGVLSPDQWARRAVQAYHDHLADHIIAERNFGGDMVAHTIRMVDPTVRVKVITASRGKAARAEPVAALYEQGRIHHVQRFDVLEEQMVTWTPESGDSPDRMDALVWALTDLFVLAADNSFAFFS
jgi:phage terminase large subunit-like protein